MKHWQPTVGKAPVPDVQQVYHFLKDIGASPRIEHGQIRIDLQVWSEYNGS